MAASDIIKAIALATLHATVNDLHARFADNLSQGGVPASADEHADDLVVKSCLAGTASPTCAPNFADAARANFQNGMAAAMSAFAAAHLPIKFQPAAAAAVQGIRAALEGGSTADLVLSAASAVKQRDETSQVQRPPADETNTVFLLSVVLSVVVLWGFLQTLGITMRSMSSVK